jgi:hypothetical protein
MVRYLWCFRTTTSAAIRSPATAYSASNPGRPVPLLVWLEVAAMLVFRTFDEAGEAVEVTALARMMLL